MTSAAPEPPRQRCHWAQSNALMRQYHDTEWGRPTRDSRLLWEMLVLESFQSGLSWNTVLQKRENFRRAFCGFDPHAVARLTPEDEARLVMDAGIIRSRSKIAATITNARAWVAMQEKGEDFAQLVWSMAPAPQTIPATSPPPSQTPHSRILAAALKARGFTFVGPVTVYAWMQAIGMVNDHEPGCFLHAS